MGFESLSYDIARVIMDYHAYRTKTSVLETTDEHTSIEHILGDYAGDIHQILDKKIREATTGNNSCRRTLLQYMNFGLFITEQARVATCLDKQETLKIQLIDFFQNLIRLFTSTTPLAITLDDSQIYIDQFGHSGPFSSQAYKLTQNLISKTNLSTNSTEEDIRKVMNDLFFFKENQIITQEISTLKQKIDQSTPTATTAESSPESNNTTHKAHTTKDWELITRESVVSEIELKNIQLRREKKILERIYENEQQHLTILQNSPQQGPSISSTGCQGLFSRKKILAPVVTEQPIDRNTGEAKHKPSTGILWLPSIQTSPFQTSPFSFMRLLRDLTLNKNFSDSASSDSSCSDSVGSESTIYS